MGKYTISIVPPNLVEVVWPSITHHIQMVVDSAYGDITEESVKKGCLNGKATLILVHDGSFIAAAMTAEIHTLDSGKRVLAVPVIGGTDLAGWEADFNKAMIEMAKHFQCTEVRGAGRPGWVRELKKLGWRPVMQVVGFEVN